MSFFWYIGIIAGVLFLVGAYEARRSGRREVHGPRDSRAGFTTGHDHRQPFVTDSPTESDMSDFGEGGGAGDSGDGGS
jgi:hypothetical protein